MTDKCATNASFVEQLKSWTNEVLPTVIDNFDDLSDEEKVKLTRLNHLFCSIHVVHNLGIYSETAVKEWEKIAAVLSRHGGFQSSNSRTYGMLFEISKLCSYTHGDQRNGKAKEWRAYLENNNLPNKITVKPRKEEPGKLRTNRLFLKVLYPLVKNQCQGGFE